MNAAANARLGVGQRLGAGLGAAGCLAMLVIGASLDPAPAGHGTHEALGLPACAWAQALDAPCATCGMTTAVTHVANGQWSAGFITQPAGAAAAFAASAAFWLAAHSALTGSRAIRLWEAAITMKGLALIGVAVGLAWAYKAVIWA